MSFYGPLNARAQERQDVLDLPTAFVDGSSDEGPPNPIKNRSVRKKKKKKSTSTESGKESSKKKKINLKLWDSSEDMLLVDDIKPKRAKFPVCKQLLNRFLSSKDERVSKASQTQSALSLDAAMIKQCTHDFGKFDENCKSCSDWKKLKIAGWMKLEDVFLTSEINFRKITEQKEMAMLSLVTNVINWITGIARLNYSTLIDALHAVESSTACNVTAIYAQEVRFIPRHFKKQDLHLALD